MTVPPATDSSAPTSGERGRLRRAIEDAAAEYGLPLKDLTVLASQHDPFRLDTPAGHRDGKWFADTMDRVGLGDRPIHLRGAHYVLIGQPRPDGRPYANNDTDWTWSQERAAKAARWLGYLPFGQIIDQRNAKPVTRPWVPPAPATFLTTGIDVVVPTAVDLMPEAFLTAFDGVQPYKLVVFGEKSSLEDVLGPLADRYRADLYLMTGEISDTYCYEIARLGAEDGRPLAVLTFADCDPAGHQMSISLGRKIQALKVLFFPDLEFEVHRVGLVPEQVRDYGLPSAPLKATELRADRWRQATGVEQTEIDALASLRPDLLRQIATNAFDTFVDTTLAGRVYETRRDWYAQAQVVIDDAMASPEMVRLSERAGATLGALRAEIEALNEALRSATDSIALPPIPAIPEPRTLLPKEALVDSRWPFVEQTRRLIDSKSYRAMDAMEKAG